MAVAKKISGVSILRTFETRKVGSWNEEDFALEESVVDIVTVPVSEWSILEGWAKWFKLKGCPWVATQDDAVYKLWKRLEVPYSRSYAKGRAVKYAR